MSPLVDRERRLEYGRAYRESHKAEVTATNALWRMAHHAELLAYYKAYYEAHKARIIQTHGEYRNTNKGQIRQAGKIYRQRVKLTRNEQKKQHYESHKTQIRQRNDAWAKANPEKAQEINKRAKEKRSRLLENGRCDLTAAQWATILKIQNYKCASCGEVKPLERDHVVPISKGGEHTASNIQGLCRHCNATKHNKPNLAHTKEDVERTVSAAVAIKGEMAQIDVETAMADRLPMVLFTNR